MNAKPASLILCLAALSAAVQAADVPLVLQEGARGYSGTQDVTLSSDPRLENDNLGGRHHIDIYNDGTVTLIRFDLSAVPKNAVVKDASLELFCHSVGFAPDEKARAWPVGVYECRQPWREGTCNPDARHTKDGATAKTSDGTKPWPDGKVAPAAGDLLGTTTHEGDQQQWYRWPLTPEAIQAWVSGSRPNHGMLVAGKFPGKAVSFTSKDSTAADKRPILRLTLSLPDADVAKLGGMAASDITWPQFVADCGTKAQETNQARTEQVFDDKYSGRIVNWTGAVFSSSRKQIGSGYLVNVLMEPTESAFDSYDLVLSAPEELKDKVLSLNKGQRVEFTARFARQGGFILGHYLDLLSIEPAKPQGQPQRAHPLPKPRRKRR